MQRPHNKIRRTLISFFAFGILAGLTAGSATAEDFPPTLDSFVQTPFDEIIGIGTTQTFSIDVSEPDGDPITSFTVSPTLPGATFTLSNENRHAEWSWTPTLADTGCYVVQFTVESTSSAAGATPQARQFEGRVFPSDRPSDVTLTGRAGGLYVQFGSTMNLSFYANDPDGDVPWWFTDYLPSGSVFTVAPDRLSATLTWTPTMADIGANFFPPLIRVSTDVWPVCARSKGFSHEMEGRFGLYVVAEDVRPTIWLQPCSSGHFRAREGEEFVILSGINEFETEDVTVDVTGLPAGATLTLDNPNDPTPMNGTYGGSPYWVHRIHLTPAIGQRGVYPFTITATSIDDVSGLPVTESVSDTLFIYPADFSSPAVVAPTSVAGVAGTLIQFTVSASDPDGSNIESFTGGGSAIQAGATFTMTGVGTPIAVGTLSWTPTSAQGGTYSATFHAVEENVPCFPTRGDPDARANASTTITVSGGTVNALPVVTAPATIAGTAGSPIQFNVSASDPDGDLIQRLVALGLNKTLGMSFTTSGLNTTSASGVFSWTPATAPQTATITFRASNGCSGPTCANNGTAVTAISVSAAGGGPATIDPIPAVTMAEGTVATVLVHANDAEGDAISVTAALPPFGMLNAPTSGSGDVSTTITLSPGLSDAGSFTATVSEAGGASVSFGITVSNTDQGLALTAPASVSAAERSLLTVDVLASDPDGEAIASLTADVSGLPPGHDAAFAIVGDPLPAVGAAGRLTWTPGCHMSGTYSVTLTAASGNTVTAVTSIAVANVGAAPSIAAIVDQTLAEGSAVTLPVSATDTDGDPITLAASLPAFGTFLDGGGGTGTLTLAPGIGMAGTYTVEVSAADLCDGVSTRTFTVTVTRTNHAPVVSIVGPASGSVYPVGTAIAFSGSFTDDSGDTHTAEWTFDTTTGAGVVDEGTGAVTGSHTFAAAGVYRISLRVSDNLGASGIATTVGEFDALVVAYDPNAGFVTGGGWINSPAGGYASGPGLVGRANFGFVSKYKKGASIPTGETEFQFKVADLNFHSEVYDWLVVSGDRAQYKGSGTVNGAGSYGFMLTAIDGQLSGGGGIDKFRIKIWDRNAGDAIVYDNQMGAGDNSTPSTALGGGSIVIHTGGNKASLAEAAPDAGGTALLPNRPNPFNPETTIRFVLAHEAQVKITIFDSSGRLVATVVDGSLGSGAHEVRWSGRDNRGHGVPSGVYHLSMESEGRRDSQRMVLLK